MVHNDEKTVGFRKATEYLKNEKGIPFSKLISKMGLERSRFDFIRTYRSKVKNEEVKKLIELYPETEQFFTSLPDNVQEPMILYNDGNTLKELIETQRKLIVRLEKENEDLKARLQSVEAENKVLKDYFKDKKTIG